MECKITNMGRKRGHLERLFTVLACLFSYLMTEGDLLVLPCFFEQIRARIASIISIILSSLPSVLLLSYGFFRGDFVFVGYKDVFCS